MADDSRSPGEVRVRWAPRVPPEPIRRLYESEARGLLDEDLLEDVSCALYARCRAILRATDALWGRVECPGCGEIVAHDSAPDALLECGRCGWKLAWRAYHRTFQGKKLYGSGAVDAFRAYVEAFERASSARDRMLAIDRMLHTFHNELGEFPTAPAAKNVIDGNIQEVVALLDGLAYGDSPAPELLETRERYRRVLGRSWAGGHVPPQVQEKLARREAKRHRRESGAEESGSGAAGTES